MADANKAPPRFAFSRRDPAAIIAAVLARLGDAGGARVLALGGQRRDRVYCAQRLAGAASHAFVEVDLAALLVEEARPTLEKILALTRALPTTLYLDGAETLFARETVLPGEQAAALAAYLRRVLGSLPGCVVLGMPEQVLPDHARLPAIDVEVTFRAPVVGRRIDSPVLLQAEVDDDALLPAHRFLVDIGGARAGLCAVSAPALVAGPYSGMAFDPRGGPTAFAALPPEQQAVWPVLRLRRSVGRSTLLYDWKRAQQSGKPVQRDLTIRQLDASGQRVVNRWLVSGCWARAWQGPAFDAMRGAVAEETLELYYCDVDWR